jgi:hypothetical protein
VIAVSCSVGTTWLVGGDNGVLGATQDIGVTWTSRTSGFGTTSIQRIVFANGLWVIVGNSGLVFTSSDGITFTSRASTMGVSTINNAAFGNGIWMIVGNGALVASSADAVTWTSRTAPAFAPGNIRAAGAAFNKWYYSSAFPIIAETADFVTWTSRVVNVPVGNTFGFTLGSNGVFAIYGSAADQFGSSTDGTTWTSRTPSLGGIAQIKKAIYG